MSTPLQGDVQSDGFVCSSATAAARSRVCGQVRICRVQDGSWGRAYGSAMPSGWWAGSASCRLDQRVSLSADFGGQTHTEASTRLRRGARVGTTVSALRRSLGPRSPVSCEQSSDQR